MTEDYLTVREVSEEIRVRVETIRIWIKEGHLKAFSLPGGEYRILKADMLEVLKPYVAKQSGS